MPSPEPQPQERRQTHRRSDYGWSVSRILARARGVGYTYAQNSDAYAQNRGLL
jgi:hypothetical protein